MGPTTLERPSMTVRLLYLVSHPIQYQAPLLRLVARQPDIDLHVVFERDSDSPSELIAIHYDTYANLVARGVIRDERRWPSPFPGGFVADPPGRG